MPLSPARFSVVRFVQRCGKWNAVCTNESEHAGGRIQARLRDAGEEDSTLSAHAERNIGCKRWQSRRLSLNRQRVILPKDKNGGNREARALRWVPQRLATNIPDQKFAHTPRDRDPSDRGIWEASRGARRPLRSHRRWGQVARARSRIHSPAPRGRSLRWSGKFVQPAEMALASWGGEDPHAVDTGKHSRAGVYLVSTHETQSPCYLLGAVALHSRAMTQVWSVRG